MGLALAASCGYHWSTGQARLSDGSRQLALAPVRNATLEPEVAFSFDGYLRREMARRGLTVAGQAEQVLETEISRVDSWVETAAMAAGRYSSQLQRVVVQARFRLRRGAEPIWEKRLEARETYQTAPDLRATEANRQAALDRALQALAGQVLEQIATPY